MTALAHIIHCLHRRTTARSASQLSLIHPLEYPQLQASETFQADVWRQVVFLFFTAAATKLYGYTIQMNAKTCFYCSTRVGLELI